MRLVPLLSAFFRNILQSSPERFAERNLAHCLVFKLTAQKIRKRGGDSSLPPLGFLLVEERGHPIIFCFLLWPYLFPFTSLPTELRDYIPMNSSEKDLYLKFAHFGGYRYLSLDSWNFLIIFSYKEFTLTLIYISQLVIKYIVSIPVSLTTMNNCLTASP